MPVQTQVRHQLPQSRVLTPQLLSLLSLCHIHATVLRLPSINRMLRHSELPGDIFGDETICLPLGVVRSVHLAADLIGELCLLRRQSGANVRWMRGHEARDSVG